MTERDELIDQAEELFAPAVPQIRESVEPDSDVANELAQGFVDAGWRPAPPPDVMEQLVRIITSDHDRGYAEHVARLAAAAGLLATPARGARR